MKKVLIISSSPRRGGNSDRLCDQFAKGAAEAGHTVETVFLKDFKVNYCTGCGACYSSHVCPQRDDAAQLIERMIAADVIVLASPVYFYTMCAQLKTLIDRTCARYTEISGKEFYYILTAADAQRKAVERVVAEFGGFLDCLEDPHEKGVVYGVGAWQIGDVESQPAMRESYEMGRAI